MDIIGHLIRTVTPAVLGDNRDPGSESLLEQFYTLFVAKLADDDSYSRISGQEIHNEDLGLFDRMWTDETHKTSITRELASANNVEDSSVKGLVATAAPLAFNELKNLAGTATTVPQFLRENLSTYRDRIPAWALGILPAAFVTNHLGGTNHTAGMTNAAPEAAHVQTGNHMSNTTSTAPLHREEKKEGGFLKALLPIIGLIILAALAWALLRGCQDKTQPVAAPIEQSAEESVAGEVLLEPAKLTLATGEGSELFACRINAGNQGLVDSVTSAVSNVFGDQSDKCRADINDDYNTEMPASEHLATILPLIKETPNTNVIIEGNDIRVNAPDEAQLNKLVSDLKSAVPSMNVLADGPLDLDSEIEASIVNANAAIDKLGDNPDPNDVARALSLQVINFEVDKAVIPDVNKVVLDRAVDVMNQVPDMELVIVGHTDAQASNEYNKELSQRRAQAVKDYLVSKGADESKLTTEGMGEVDPIATNETEQGRFRNRRIEFKVYDESMSTDEPIIVAEDSDVPTEKSSDMVDPDMNPLDADNDDVLPDQDDPSKTQTDAQQ